MSILFVMIPLAVLLLAAAVWSFFWAVRTGQFDDLEKHGTLAEAGRAVIDEIGALGGDGGLIALDRDGNITAPFNSQGMKRAWLTTDGEIGVEVFGR